MNISGILFLAGILLHCCASVSQARLLDDAGRGGSAAEASGSLRRLLATGHDSCSDIIDEIFFFTRDVLVKGPDNPTKNSAECCKLCDEHPECKSWTRIKATSTYHDEGECWLMDHVPIGRKCETCESGKAVPTEAEDSDEILDKCVEDGQAAAEIAVIGACRTLTRICPAKKDDGDSRILPAISGRSVADVVERTCDILFEDACIRNAFTVASSGGDDCASIILHGPDDAVNVPECADYETAIDVFQSVLTKACVG